MNYRNLQKALKPLKDKGLTDIKLTSSAEELRTEYQRLVTDGLLSPRKDDQSSSNSQRPCSVTADSGNSSSQASSKQELHNHEEEIEVDPEIEALVAESWTDNPERAIATAAAYAVTGLAMFVLWIAFIATTLAISGLKCWHWCRSQYSDLALQLTYFDPSLEFPAFAKPQLMSLIPVRSSLVH